MNPDNIKNLWFSNYKKQLNQKMKGHQFKKKKKKERKMKGYYISQI